MAKTITLPGIGPTDQRYVIAGGALVVGIVGYAYWRRASAAPVDAAAVDAATGATDYGPDYASTAAGGSGVTSGYSSGATTVVTDGNLPPRDNAEWTRRVIEYMGNIGYEYGAVSAALGNYLARKPLNAAEVQLVNTARGAIGPPPIGDFPVTAAATTPTTTAPTPTTPATPATGGKKPAAPSVTVSNLSSASVTVTWPKITGADTYTVFLRTPYGSTGGYTGQATYAHLAFAGLGAVKPGDKCSVLVYASNNYGRSADVVKSFTVPK